MSGLRRGIVQTSSRSARLAFERLSKAALFDIVVDLIRRNEGEELDGNELYDALREAAAPVLFHRGDRPLPETP